MQEKFENHIKDILTLIGEDPQRDGLLKTPSRVFKSFEFLTSGYKQDPKEILSKALFDSTNNEMILVRDIEFYSLCEHHLLPFFGRAHIAYIPDKKVLGLSKFARLVELYARRLQIQEQLTEQIAEALISFVGAKGVGVVLEARHMCMEMRGVQKANATTLTSALRGSFLANEKTRKEFFSLINSSKQVKF
ncbi:GTP cyclohydrolase I [Campylobacter avium LMG 24591]|uniref:GTP cyclohydrolase 1 n=1 Tax=Campylobacter avium LMG 24591 TaxID=522484 RepID=A0A222MUI5_9BACT|nr:GTP cyclohydrolase I FolE [Campylobacter avium]ASQ29704.1 GTP cyclohydrolase I [Campylobacter avium LMG 24591]OYD80020.1 GTP cyclohydrolase I [Campylobacter avium]HJE66834.1 GTP cyclohydrolase I FolE [Campylobacter avium]